MPVRYGLLGASGSGRVVCRPGPSLAAPRGPASLREPSARRPGRAAVHSASWSFLSHGRPCPIWQTGCCGRRADLVSAPRALSRPSPCPGGGCTGPAARTAGPATPASDQQASGFGGREISRRPSCHLFTAWGDPRDPSGSSGPETSEGQRRVAAPAAGPRGTRPRGPARRGRGAWDVSGSPSRPRAPHDLGRLRGPGGPARRPRGRSLQSRPDEKGLALRPGGRSGRVEVVKRGPRDCEGPCT